MKPERIRSHPRGPKVRPMCPEIEAEVIAGMRESMRKTGYDWPVRKVRRVGNSDQVTLPPQVRDYLELSRGDWLVFGRTEWRGLFGLMKVDQKRAEAIIKSKGDGYVVPIRKVHWSKRQASITIPKIICERLGIQAGDSVVFVPPVQFGIVGMGIIRNG